MIILSYLFSTSSPPVVYTASNLLLVQTLNGSLFKLDIDNSGQIIWSSKVSNTPLISLVYQKQATDIQHIQHKAETNLILPLDININFVYKYQQSKQEIELMKVHPYQDENQKVFIESFQTSTTTIDLVSGGIFNESYKTDQSFLPRSAETIVTFCHRRRTCIKNLDQIYCYNQSAISDIKYFSNVKAGTFHSSNKNQIYVENNRVYFKQIVNNQTKKYKISFIARSGKVYKQEVGRKENKLNIKWEKNLFSPIAFAWVFTNGTTHQLDLFPKIGFKVKYFGKYNGIFYGQASLPLIKSIKEEPQGRLIIKKIADQFKRGFIHFEKAFLNNFEMIAEGKDVYLLVDYIKSNFSYCWINPWIEWISGLWEMIWIYLWYLIAIVIIINNVIWLWIYKYKKKIYSSTSEEKTWLFTQRFIEKKYPGSTAYIQDIKRKVYESRNFSCLNIDETTTEFFNELFGFDEN